jgi:hypothetical protein
MMLAQNAMDSSLPQTGAAVNVLSTSLPLDLAHHTNYARGSNPNSGHLWPADP